MKTISLRQFNREVTTLNEPVNLTVRTVNGEIRNLGTFLPTGATGVLGRAVTDDIPLGWWVTPEDVKDQTKTLIETPVEHRVIPGKLPSELGPRMVPGGAPRSTTTPGAQERFGAPRPAPKVKR